MKILLTGKNGQVGWELERTLSTVGEVFAVDREGMDLANPDSIRSRIREVRPDLIVNPAAYTAVDKAESEPELAMAINGVAPGIMAEEAKRLGAAIVHYSTDYVFDGTKTEAYREDDAPAPINVYGATKLAGERAIQEVGAPHLIFRTSWVYGMRGKNFLLTMLRLAQEKEELRIVSDQIGAPTWCRAIAEGSAQIIARVGATGPLASGIADVSGIYHLTNGGSTSWFGFTEAIIDQGRAIWPERRWARLTPITTQEYPTPARRPTNSRMDSARLQSVADIALPDWKDSLRLCLAE